MSQKPAKANRAAKASRTSDWSGEERRRVQDRRDRDRRLDERRAAGIGEIMDERRERQGRRRTDRRDQPERRGTK